MNRPLARGTSFPAWGDTGPLGARALVHRIRRQVGTVHPRGVSFFPAGRGVGLLVRVAGQLRQRLILQPPEEPLP